MSENFSETPVNLQQLRDSAVGDEGLMRELIEIYISETEKTLVELKQSVAEKDFSGIYKNAHKIIGGSLTCGMQKIIPYLRRLEEIGRAENFADAEEVYKSAENAYAEMKSFLSVRNLTDI